MKKVKNSLQLLVSVALIVVVMACGNGGSSQGEDSDEITIRIFTRISGSDPQTGTLLQSIDDFEAKYPNVTIQDESINDSNAFTSKFKTDIASGNVADIIHWPGISIMKEYAENGVFLNVEDLINADDDVKNNIESSMFEMMDLTSIGVPGIYAVPFSNQMEVFYYRKDLFEKAGITSPPQTWDEFYVVCEKLEQIGIVPWSVGASNSWRLVHIQTGLMYRSHGVDQAKNLGSGEANWNDPDMVANIAFMQDLAERGIFGDDYLGIDYETEKARFINGETAMSFDGSWRVGALNEVMDNVGTFRMPYFASKPEFYEHDISYPSQFELGGHLADDPDKLKFVWEFVSDWLSKTTQETLLYDIANIPVRTDIVYEESKLNPILLGMLNDSENVKYWASDAWAYDEEPSLEVIVGEAYVGALSGLTAQEAANQIQSNLDNVRSN